MGIIRYTKKAATNIVYKVDVMKAVPADVHQLIDTHDAGGEDIVVAPETYVKVVGSLGSSQNKKRVWEPFSLLPRKI